MLHYLEQTESSTTAIPTEALTFANVSRRSFLSVGAAGFAVAAFAGPADAFIRYPVGGKDMPHGLRYDPKIFVSIDADGTVTIVQPH